MGSTSFPSLHPSDALPRDRVLAHLEKINLDAAIEYLEYLIRYRGDKTAEFHNKLVLRYLDQLLTTKDWKEAEKRNKVLFIYLIYKDVFILRRLIHVVVTVVILYSTIHVKVMFVGVVGLRNAGSDKTAIISGG